ncbi:MAG: NfeD family protein [Candidatus Rokubacteria bacterium]|nr:NfeD family protein [Candidatus Rokubacteria bacterium]
MIGLSRRVRERAAQQFRLRPWRPNPRTLREFGSYLLWQLPSWVTLALVLIWLSGAIPFDGWIAVAVLSLFVIKDVLLFPALGAAFRRPSHGPWPIGKQARAVEPLEPSGYVRVDGELWKAEALRPGARIPAGTTVVVRAAHGLLLLVEQDGRIAADTR